MNLNRQFKLFIKSVIHRQTLHTPINRLLTDSACNIETSLMRIAKLGFNPELIFDVGAYQGDFTKFCLQLWTDTEVACFEVLPNKVTQLKQLELSNSSIQVIPVLLGETSSEQVPFFQFQSEGETASSVMKPQNSSILPKYYPMRTVDEIVNTHLNGRVPDLLKMDVQGYELNVLKGAEQSLDKIKVILAEVNLLDLYQDAPLLSELITWLDARNWVTYDICGFWRRPLDQALWQADFIFVQRTSFLRADKRYRES